MTADEATVLVIDALETMGVDYMIVGSLSSNFYGVPRATQDADFVLTMRTTGVMELANRLGPAFRLDPQGSFETATATQRYRLHVTGSRFEIELFLLSDDPHDQQRFQRRLQVPMLGRTVWMPTAEDVIAMKLRWIENSTRNKDIDDVRNVIAVQGDRIDWDYVHGWCAQHGTRGHLDAIRASISSE